MEDGFGRTIDYLRISLTDRCNLRCLYCMPATGIATKLTHDDILHKDELLRLVRVLATCGIKKVRLTGGEPLIRKNILGVVDGIAHTPGIEDVSLTTNGLLLPRYARELKEAGLNRVNISLDTLDAEKYHFVTRLGNIEDALAGIEAAFSAGFDPIKVNAVAVRSLEQDFYGFARMSVERPLHVRFIEYMPVGAENGLCGGTWGREDVISGQEIRARINERAACEGVPGLVDVDEGEQPKGYGPARYWRFPGAAGTVGFISALSQHFCAQCNRMRLTADGKLRPCLFSDTEYDIRAVLRDPSASDEDVAALYYTALRGKPEAHNDRVGTERRMSQIGG